jgi:nucleotide-binding universal stress UspA family protein
MSREDERGEGIVFRKILVPVDFTDKNEAALRTAMEIAGRGEAGSETTLLHVIESIEHLEPGEMADFYRSLETRATARLFALQERFKEAGATVRQELLIGKRAETIVRYAEDNDMDLVILSSHKVDRDHPALGLGTLSYRIAIVVRCPVLLVK